LLFQIYYCMIVAPFPKTNLANSAQAYQVKILARPQLVHSLKNKYLGVFILCISVICTFPVISHHYQIDFSAYYSAAKLLAHGANPYVDSLTGEDGKLFIHSEYLQPPLVAALFWPLSLFSYDIAKTFWFLIQILLVIGILIFSASDPVLDPKTFYLTSLLVAGSFFIFWPVYTLFERGQTDLFVLFWICLGYTFWKRGHPVAAGFVIVIAALFKLPAAFLLTVPLASRGRKPAIGAGLALGILLVASLLIVGIELNRLYLTEYLPEIIRTGHNTSEDPAFGKGGASSAQIIWEGKTYKTATGFQSSIGSIIPTIYAKSGDLNRGLVSLAAFSLAALLIFVFLQFDHSNQAGRLAWIFALLSTLLFHPLTWVMTYVWLLPVVFIGYDSWRSFIHSILVQALAALGLLGMLLICIGEQFFMQINRWIGIPGAHIAGQTINLWSNLLIVNRIWIGGSLLWLVALAFILIELGTVPFVTNLRRFLSPH